jgi:DedD protein
MGLFSNKNKRDRAAEDSGRFYSKDDDAAIGERARAKRASHAGATAGGATRRPGNDPMLPEKKRARRRLVGAIALALAAAIGLPMLLDSQPKQLAGDIAIQIPSKDKAAPLPVPAAPAEDEAASAAASAKAPAAETPAKPAAPAPAASAGTRSRTVAAADSVDQGEEVIDAPPMPKAPKAEVRKSEPKPEHKEPKEQPKAEREHERHDASKAEHKETRPERKPEPKPEPVKPRIEDKPVKPHEDARALAILEGKGAARVDAEAPASSPKSMVQVAAMSSEEKAAEVQAKLRAAGISSTTEKSANGLVRVKIGPYTKDEADKARAKVARLGL